MINKLFSIDENGIINADGRMIGYVFTHGSYAYAPDGYIGADWTKEQINAHNAALDRLTIARLDLAGIGDRGTLYTRPLSEAGTATRPATRYEVTTWLGAPVAVGRVSGRVLTFHRELGNGTIATFRGTLRKSGDLFTYRRVR